MKVNKYVYNCDRCGKDVGYPPLYTINVYSRYDESQYHFCEDCYKEIHDVMKDKNQVAVPLSKIKEELKKLIDNAPEKYYVPIYYPVYYLRDWWDPSYPKVRYTTTITGGPKEGTSINANKNVNDVTVCCCDSERRI